MNRKQLVGNDTKEKEWENKKKKGKIKNISVSRFSFSSFLVIVKRSI